MAGLSIGDPVKLSVALTSNRILPGDEIVLLPGTYNATIKGTKGSNNPGQGVFLINLNGTEAAPITIRPLTPSTVRINGGIDLLNSSWVILKDLEIGPTPTTRLTTRTTADFPDGIYIASPNCKVVGCYIHDGIEGISLFGSPGAVIAENIIINNGVSEPDLHGTGIYTHNNAGGEIILEHNIWNTMGEHAINMWSAGANNVQDYICRKNATLHSAVFAGVYGGLLQDILIEDNHVWRASMRLGLVDSENNDTVIMRRNRAYTQYVPLTLYWQRAATITDNIFSNDEQVIAVYDPSDYSIANAINNNTYHVPTNGGFYDYTTPGGVRTLAQWQTEHGYDLGSTYDTTLPAVNEIFVYPFTYSGRWQGMVVVWNWAADNSVTVDLSSITALDPADVVRVRNSQSPLLDYQDLTLNEDSEITIDMRAISHSVLAPIEWTAQPTTFPGFGAFVVEKQ